MPPTLDPQVRRALADRIRYYNELGIYDFYRRKENTPGLQPEQREPLPKTKAVALSAAPHLVEATIGAELTTTDPAQALKLIRRSEEHTSELQSRFDLVCRLLLEKKKRKQH